MRKKSPSKLTSKEQSFAAYVAGGDNQADAARKAYGHPEWSDQRAAEAGSRVAARPDVTARINELRNRSVAGRLLTVNDRLHLLARAADFIPKTAGERQAQARVLDVYTKLAGGGSPEQHEVTLKGDPAAPIAVSVVVHRVPVLARIAALREAKEKRG